MLGSRNSVGSPQLFFYVESENVATLLLKMSLEIVDNNLLHSPIMLLTSRDICKLTRRPPSWIFTDMQRRHSDVILDI